MQEERTIERRKGNFSRKLRKKTTENQDHDGTKKEMTFALNVARK